MSRSRLAIWNYSSVWLFTAVTLLGLVSTRYVIEWIGDDKFGAFRMTSDALGYLGLFELGLTSALSPMLARALASRDRDQLTRTAAEGLRAFAGLTLIVVSISLVMLGGVTWLIPVAESSRRDLQWAWGISILSLWPILLAPFRSLADARQRGYRINLALTMQSLLIFGLSMTFARFGFGIAGQAAAVTIATLPLALFLTADGLKQYPDLLKAAWTVPRDGGIRGELLALAVPSFLIAFGGRVSVLSDTLIVGKILDSATAAHLWATQRLTFMAQGQLQAIGASSWAGLAELHNQGNREQFNRRLIELTGLTAFLGMAGLTPITAYNHHFIDFWVGASRDGGVAVVLIAAFNALCLGLFSLWFWCFSGTGQIKSMVPMSLLGSGVNLASSIVFTKMFGIFGPLLGSTFSYVTISLWYLPYRLNRTFGTSVWGLYRAVLVPLAWGIPYGVLLWVVATSHRPWGWVGLGFEMGTAALFFLLLGSFAILSPEERRVWAGRIRGAIPRRAS